MSHSPRDQYDRRQRPCMECRQAGYTVEGDWRPGCVLCEPTYQGRPRTRFYCPRCACDDCQARSSKKRMVEANEANFAERQEEVRRGKELTREEYRTRSRIVWLLIATVHEQETNRRDHMVAIARALNLTLAELKGMWKSENARLLLAGQAWGTLGTQRWTFCEHCGRLLGRHDPHRRHRRRCVGYRSTKFGWQVMSGRGWVRDDHGS